MNESSLMILQDSKLDYTKELIGSQFKIVDSPYILVLVVEVHLILILINYRKRKDK